MTAKFRSLVHFSCQPLNYLLLRLLYQQIVLERRRHHLAVVKVAYDLLQVLDIVVQLLQLLRKGRDAQTKLGLVCVELLHVCAGLEDVAGQVVRSRSELS